MICGKILADPDKISMEIPDDGSLLLWPRWIQTFFHNSNCKGHTGKTRRYTGL